MKKGIIGDEKLKDKIRKAFRAGRKTIVIEGNKFTMSLLKRPVSFETTVRGEKKQTKRTEQWLVLNQVGGGITAQIEYPKANSNLRSKF